MGSAKRRVLMLCGAFIVVLGVVALFTEAPSPPASAIGRVCRLEKWPSGRHHTELVIARLKREDGSDVVLSNGTPCVVLEENDRTTRIRVTDGLYKGITGWVASGEVVLNDAAKP